jgi:hypothetical protein
MFSNNSIFWNVLDTPAFAISSGSRFEVSSPKISMDPLVGL